jgi:YVTN family beta-propeller protein
MLAVVACKGDRQASTGAPTATAARGPDQIVLRIPRAGGTARAYVYPRLDSAAASVPGSPPIARVLAFDPDEGVLAFVDDKELPRRLDLRAAEVRTASKEKLSAVTSLNGSDIYAVTTKGTIARITPSGDWSFEPPAPARWVFPLPNGSAIIAGNSGGKTQLWLIRPTDEEIIETASLPLLARNIKALVGDRIYFAVDSGLIGVRTRDLQPVKSLPFKQQVEALVATPSGDRVYVALNGSNTLSVVDRYTETIAETVDLPGPVSDLRMDPLGQSVLAKPADGRDSAWVIGIGTDKVNGTIATAWRNDLPAFAPGGSIAAARGADVVFVDENTLAVQSTVADGAKDSWYFVTWNGFRPRAADLDRPVTFDTVRTPVSGDSSFMAPRSDSTASPPLRDAAGPTMIEPPPHLTPSGRGYVVSFAAVLSQQKANETASAIVVNGVHPRVVSSQSGSTTLYRVVLGPYSTREEADRVGRDSKRQFWIYEESQ